MKPLVLLAGLATLSGCARHVVIDPKLVPSYNDRAWTIQSEPAPASSHSPSMAADPQLPALEL